MMAVQITKARRATALTREVGGLIRAAREAKRLTQSELAERTGRSLQMIGRVERGAAAPSFETLTALAAATDVPVAAFFQLGSYTVGTANTPLSRIVNRLSKLDADDLEWAEELLRVAMRRKVRAS
jgi:transcriptional regulator with XRE-family HTH domain